MSKTESIALLSSANRMLAEVKTIDDAKHLKDMAAAVKLFAKKHKLGHEAVAHAHEIEIRAEIKMGEYLDAMEKNKGGRPKEKTGTHDVPVSEQPTYEEIGITKNEAAVAQTLFSSPKEEQEAVAIGKKSKRKVVAKARQKKRNEKIKEQPKLPDDKYDIIYVDPPWEYDFSETSEREIENQYPTMTLDALKALGDKIPTDKNAVIFMWATAPKLVEAMEVMEAWGFEYKTNAVWDKEIIGMGYWVRGQHELLLIGVKGKFSPPEEKVRVSSVYRERRGKHSKKPDYYYEVIEKYFPGRKWLELFARKVRPGWATWGNEV